MRLCQARSFRTSSRSAREAANARPRRSSGRLASSQPRISLRNASSRSLKSKFIFSIGSPRPAGPQPRDGLQLALLHDHATVDVQRLAGDVARLVRGEEHGSPADVLGGLLALHRRDVAHALVEHLARRHALEGGIRLGQVGGELLPEVGPEHTRTDRVHGDAVGRQLLGDDAREGDHAHLRHAVGRHRRRRDRPSDRGDVHDAARLALDEVRRDRLAREKDRLRVDREGAVPVFLGIVRERHARRTGGARVVDEDVDLAERLARAVDHRLDVGGAGDVGLHREDLAAQALDLAGDLLGVQHLDVRNGDVGAFARQRQHDATADPATAARHNRDLAGEPHGDPPRSIIGAPEGHMTAHPLRSRNWFGRNDLDGFVHRSWLKAEGFSDAVFDGRPVIGIANSWSELTNCNAHMRQVADAVKRGVWSAGGFPVEFPTISLGEVLMKPTTMLFRNLMAMDVEECLRAYPLDAAVLLSGCDKTTPAMLMGAASADIPAVMVTGGPMLSGKWRAEELGSGTDAWRLWAERRSGRLTDEELCEAESCMSRSSGHCMVMGTTY